MHRHPGVQLVIPISKNFKLFPFPFDFSPSTLPLSLKEYVTTLRSKLEEIQEQAREQGSSERKRRAQEYDKRKSMREFGTGDLVYLYETAVRKGEAKKFRHPWSGPYKIIEKISPWTYAILLPTNKRYVVHINRLKPVETRSHPCVRDRDRPLPVVISGNEERPERNGIDPKEIQEMENTAENIMGEEEVQARASEGPSSDIVQQHQSWERSSEGYIESQGELDPTWAPSMEDTVDLERTRTPYNLRDRPTTTRNEMEPNTAMRDFPGVNTRPRRRNQH